MNMIPLDITGRVIKVGDVISSSAFDHGTTVRVLSVESMGAAFIVRVASRGRVSHYVSSSGWRIVS